MNGHFFTRTRLLLIALLLVPWLLLLFSQSVLRPEFRCVLGTAAIICTFVALAFLSTPILQERPTSDQRLPAPSPETSLPSLQTEAQPRLSIPRTLAQVYKMDPTDFEIFSAAIIVGGVGDGHRFVAHSGRRGDRGVDVRLLNKVGMLVVVQSKRYVPPRRVRPHEVRDFAGAIQTHDAVYGYFVTSSTFTSAALDEKRSHGRIRTINGPEIDRLLQTRAPQIDQAHNDIRQQIKARMR